jgi:putative transcriptional regulator
MQEFRQRTGKRVTYDQLAAMTKLSKASLQAIGSRDDYNPTLAAIDRICTALGCNVSDLLDHVPDRNTVSRASARRRTRS